MSLRLVLGSMWLVCACSAPGETPDDASADAPPGLRVALIRARQAEGADDPRFFAVREDGALALRSGVVAARVEARGVALRGGEVHARLETRAVRCDAESVAARDGVARIGARPNRVELERAPGVVEWYESGPLGIEQGFDVHREGCDELVIELAVQGARAEADGEGARLVGERGALRYAELFAIDARGRALPARMDVSEGAIELVVDAQGASWPVVVDPLVHVEEQIFGPEGTPGDVAWDVGRSVAIEGDTAVVGAPHDVVGGSYQGSAYVFVRSGGGWALQAKLIASDGADSDHFGSTVAISGDTIVVALDREYLSAAYVFVRSGGVWTEQAKLTSAYEGIDYFGFAVAIAGDTIAIGAPFANDLEVGSRVHVFRRTGATWAREAIITSAWEEALGWNLSLSGDTLVMAARGGAEVYVRSGTTWARRSVLPGGPPSASGWRSGVVRWGDTVVVADPSADSERGALTVFVRSGETWAPQARLVASDAREGARFGTGLALWGDELIVTNAPAPRTGGTPTLYVFRRSGETWTERQSMRRADDRPPALALSSDTLLVGRDVFARTGDTWTLGTALPAEPSTTGHELGRSVAVSGDVAIAGAPGDDGLCCCGACDRTGAAYVFARTGGVWARQAKLVSPGAARFGQSVAVSGDTALVVASGSTYVFVRAGDGWIRQARLAVSGESVALAGDVALVGAPDALPGADGGGAAHVFVRTGSTWTEQARLSASDGEYGDRFGASVALSGEIALVGAPGRSPSGTVNAGVAYVFARSGDTWVEQARWTPSRGVPRGQFGASVSVSGEVAVVGGYGERAVGAVHVFRRRGGAWAEEAELAPPEVTLGQWFGYSVSISGGTIVVGTSRGVAYVFARVGAEWRRQEPIALRTEWTHLGRSVAVEGNTVVVGAPDDYGVAPFGDWDEGAVYFGRLDRLPDANGVPCTTSGDCVSGHCVDGVCCESACGGDCDACASALTGVADGTCAALAASVAPTVVCRAGAGACDVAETCSASSTECPDDVLAAGIECGVASCAAGVETSGATCSGASAACPPASSRACAPYVCGASACLDACTDDASCAAGFYCDAGACIAQRAAGETCSEARECASGHCVDGACCESACVRCASDAECGAGRACEDGACVDLVPHDAGVDGGIVDAGSDAGDDDAGSAPDAGAPTETAGGCGCAVPGRGGPTPVGAVVVLALLLAVGARRRRAAIVSRP
ncbi:MYXO-CTERM sorting domain-containing protein [Sandaracinus amylolyticus]|uniref:Hemagglutinin protein n=1 Tax=Sandaracinus amylolyticus TaxID=927083 RepID=A0A0F6W028_9BACT|nr:MYXO-CTERM sorting domain-containing protein [Sandaracinus amylolyticus]AKF03821.1 hemagglutinin protein [Sandaracinus amylolyticus]